MAGELSVRTFDQNLDLDDAAGLLAARHRSDRRRLPVLPERFEDISTVRESLQETASFAEGVSACGRGRLAGFLFGIRLLPSPTSTAARLGGPRSTMMFAHGHAAAEIADTFSIYHSLYAALAEEWVRDGFFDHRVHVPAGPAEQPWFKMGFGRHMAVAARNLRPPPSPFASRAEVRPATPDDITAVMELSHSGTAFHTSAPLFQPDSHRDAERALREEFIAQLSNPAHAIFLARESGRDVGMLGIGPSRGSAMFTPDGAAYISNTAVLETSRRSGVGSTLLQTAIAWAREHSYEHLTLHFATANALSRAFWSTNGFEPVMYHLRRQIDERILWARPSQVR